MPKRASIQLFHGQMNLDLWPHTEIYRRSYFYGMCITIVSVMKGVAHCFRDIFFCMFQGVDCWCKGSPLWGPESGKWWEMREWQCTTVWLQQTVRLFCWSSMFIGIWPKPTNKWFISAYLKIKYLKKKKFTVLHLD